MGDAGGFAFAISAVNTVELAITASRM